MRGLPRRLSGAMCRWWRVSSGILGKGEEGKGGIQMRVEVDDADGPVGAGDAAEERERDGVVAAECDNSREGLALEGRAFLVWIRGWGSAQNAVMAILDLLNGVGVVVSMAPLALHLQIQIRH